MGHCQAYLTAHKHVRDLGFDSTNKLGALVVEELYIVSLLIVRSGGGHLREASQGTC